MRYGGRGPPHCPLWVSPLPAIEGAPLPAPSGGPEPHPHLPGQVLRIRVDPQAEDAVEMGRLYPHPGQLVGELRLASSALDRIIARPLRALRPGSGGNSPKKSQRGENAFGSSGGMLR